MLHALLFVILLGAVFVILYYLCNKVGGTSAMKIKTSFSFHCARFALPLNKVGCTSAMKIKTSFLFIALGLHYL